jgi:uncharacterized protein (DUF1015 family)
VTDVRPLRGIRFDPAHAGPVGPLIAPPYDAAAISSSVTGFGIGGIENIDIGVSGDPHAHAAARYRAWREQGVLHRDADPAIYIHQHRFDVAGVARERTALIARVRLADWSERIVLPHERTTPGPRAERLARLRAVGANLSPLYFLFRDADSEIRRLIASVATAAAPPALHDRMGGTHTIVPVAHPSFHDRLALQFAQRTVFVADGHHRYEAALDYRDERRAAGANGHDAPSEFVLAMLAPVEDSGVLVRPTHRLLLASGGVSPQALLDLLRRWFGVRPAPERAMPAHETGYIGRVVLPSGFGVWDLYALPGRPHEALFPSQRGAAWRSLGVAAVEAILESFLGASERSVAQHVAYAIDESAAIRQVERGEAQAAFLLPAPRLDRVLAVAEEGDLLPAKSTWFEPKAPAGLVINDLSAES